MARTPMDTDTAWAIYADMLTLIVVTFWVALGMGLAVAVPIVLTTDDMGTAVTLGSIGSTLAAVATVQIRASALKR